MRTHSPGPFKNIESFIFDKNSELIGVASISIIEAKFVDSNIALFTNAPNMLDVITQYLDSMRDTKAQGSIAWEHALTVYEAASRTKYDYTMSKSQAIYKMMLGERLTHTYFTIKEWITMNKEGSIVTEEGYIHKSHDFWPHRQGESFDFGWEIWKE